MEQKQKQSTENFIKDIRRKSRRLFSSEQKLIIVMEAQRGENSVTEICRKHGISQATFYITKSPFQKPPTPTIVRDSAGNLTSNYATGNQWYKDGVAIAGATDVKYKPLVNASYNVTTVQNGCASLKGYSYYYLVTDIINLEDNQFIKVMPNPYVSNLYLNFFLIKYNTLNADIFDFSTGRMVANRKNLSSGTNLDVANLSSGIYLVRVYSTDFKMTYTFKIVKL